jgi:hypothetical protein
MYASRPSIDGIVALAISVLALGGTLVASDSANAGPARIDAIIPSKGNIQLKREDWPKYQPAVTIGTTLDQGDLLFPAQGVRVMVVCPDLTTRPVSAGVPSGLKKICPVWNVIAAKGSQSPEVLGGTNALIPYLIFPRHTLALSNTPIFRWNAVRRATQYTVKLVGPTGMVWEKQVKDNQVLYPGTPPLEPGTTYALTIQTNTGKTSEEEKSSNLDFKVLRQSEADTIKTEAEKIISQNLSKEVTAMLLADLYSTYILPELVISTYGLTPSNFRSYNLTDQAIVTLETLVRQGKAAPIIYRTLGDLYWQSGLANLAADHYLKAIELGKEPQDMEERTLAQYGLGEVYAATNNTNQAIHWYSQAANGYASLGYTQRADFLKQQIESLKQQ